MKRMLLALVLAGAVVSTATADYILIVANLGKKGGNAPPAKPKAPPPPPPPAANQPPPGIPRGPGAGQPGEVGGVNQPNPPPAALASLAPAAAPFDPDTAPFLCSIVVEVDKKLTKLEAARLQLGGGIPATAYRISGFDGKMPFANTTIASLSAIHPNGKASPGLGEVYAGKLKALVESKTPATAEQWAELGEWSLAHGRLDHFKEHMEKAMTLDKDFPKCVAYRQTKEALAKSVENIDTAGPWRKQLLTTRYQTTTTPHYAILSNDAPATESRKKRLEDTLQTFYYWFGTHNLQLPVPTRRQVVIITNDTKEFKHLNTVLDSTPVVSDSFYARRENITVFSSRPLDSAYIRVQEQFAPLIGQGFNKDLLLQGKGYPPQLAKTGQWPQIYEAMTLALLMKALELESEVAGTEHGATRQLLYATGFLPATVAAPEWVQFGASTFFETSPGSPWATVGLPSFEYGPLFKDLLTARKLPPDPLDMLRLVVTDGFFRNPEEGLTKDAALRKARATAWSLCHFLIRKRMDGLQRYFTELAQMPRDLALDENSLWLAFARAFNAVDATGQPDLNALRTLADDWDKDLRLDQYDNREIDLMRTMRLTYQQVAIAQTTAPALPPNGVLPPGGIAPGGGRPGGFGAGGGGGVGPGRGRGGAPGGN